MNFYNLLEEYSEYKNLRQCMQKHDTPVSISGVVDSAHSQLIYALSKPYKNALCIVYSDMEAKSLCSDLEFFTDKCAHFPSKEYVFYNIETKGHENEHERLEVISSLYKQDDTEGANIIVASVNALMEYTCKRELYEKNTLIFTVGGKCDLEKTERALINGGYTREDMVEGRGQFSIRGGIIDVFPPTGDTAVRIELFDDEVDSIRLFDASTQRSLTMAEDAVIPPCRELIAEDVSNVVKEIEKQAKKLEKQGKDASVMRSDIEKFTERGVFPSADKYVSLIYGEIPTLIDYLDDDTAVFLIEPKRINERVKTFMWDKNEIITELCERGEMLPKKEYYYDYAKLAARISKMRMASINVLSHTTLDYTYRQIFNFTTKTTISFHGKVDYLYDDLSAWQKNGYTVVILAGSRVKGENLAGTLADKGIKSRFAGKDAEFEKGEIVVLSGDIAKGFEYPEIKLVVVSDREIFETKRRRKRVDNTDKIKSFNDISPGDYVVHRAHGIGQYVGTQKMTVGGVTKDYLKIQYKGTDSLYVPVEQLDVLYKYIGSTDTHVKLNKLGGTEWSKTKARVKESTADMAKQLVALYKAREQMKGYAFSGDTPWQRDFENTFEYQETEDQLRSIEEVKKDMESSRPMDRLLCGDVGYGKTEVALRAAFKAATDGKQVAYLCPTTILAMQQYTSFCDRMADFPIKVEMLSRFRTAAQQRQILKKLKKGEVDIIIGTHRILQKDVEFKDLGLLIVDEEQRFGVAHKERLKEIKKNIDVLTMTATPIPRTLHMAMVNIRDMSVLTQPPQNRYPVQTYVLEHNESVLIDAMKNELSRGGQVFYLFNRVQGIYRVAEWIQSKIPEARVAVGHGKMNEEQLEDIMYDMVNGATDILVCTTIIETGLDIPNANTIIIENADRMGLSQLYQLRGRVGRSNRAAYAYFTYTRDKMLSDVAQKRLRAVKEFTEFGSGFKIAMRDLEIRGAGNILGAQQHGHMDAVGYDMYCKLLKESVDEVQGIETVDDVQMTVDINVSAYIPETYIYSADQRIDVYKKIAAIEGDEDRMEIEDELIDRFGDIPRAVNSLIDIACIKAAAKECGICEIMQKNGKIIFVFTDSGFDLQAVMGLPSKLKIKLVPTAKRPSMECPAAADVVGNIKFILQSLKELKCAEK